MEDLAGLDWTAGNASSKKLPGAASATAGTSNANYFPTLRPTPPLSGRTTPSQSTTGLVQSNGDAKSKTASSTSAADSFANLVPFSTSSSKRDAVPLAEQQQQQQQQTKRQGSLGNGGLDLESRRAHLQVLDAAASNGRSVSAPRPPSSSKTESSNPIYTPPLLKRDDPFAANRHSTNSSNKSTNGNDDLLAAFDSSSVVNKATHMPTPQAHPSITQTNPNTTDGLTLADDDDDPFGLQEQTSTSNRPAAAASATTGEDDDVLGLLGKPVSEFTRPQSQQPIVTPAVDPHDQAVAELVEMGFSAEQAQDALASTPSGIDVQAAVSVILNAAHAQTPKEQRPSSRRLSGGDRARAASQSQRTTNGTHEQAVPAWMRQQTRSASATRRPESSSTPNLDRDAAQVAAELGSSLFKTANSLWKTGTRKLNQAVADLNAEPATPSQPRWMSEAQNQGKARRPSKPERTNTSEARIKSPTTDDLMTSEAMMLEASDARPKRKQSNAANLKAHAAARTDPLSQGLHSINGKPQRGSEASAAPSSRTRVTRQQIEEDNAAAYISPARRKRAPPNKATEPDLLFDAENADVSNTPTRSSAESSRPNITSKSSTPLPSRAKPVQRPAPTRSTIPISPIALESSTKHRRAGTDAFRVGNYADAAVAYTSALRDLPARHPLIIVVLTNRSLTHLKTGDPKAAVSDAETALDIIGTARGSGELIDFGPPDGNKDMAPYWGKAMMRRGEALEQLERWTDALKIWTECVQAGVGGSTSMQGRTRCELALGRNNASKGSHGAAAKKPSARKPAAAPLRSKASALDDLSGKPAGLAEPSAAAVTRLREANAQAERLDEEKFALADAVDERLTRWRGGKEGNLRALLGSLDTVLWEGAEWQKVGMSELLLPAKVKIAYMRGIAKVHPDKLPTTATTEQVMISAAVFSTLNEAWDRFKAENGL